jgi:hypothetical protein
MEFWHILVLLVLVLMKEVPLLPTVRPQRRQRKVSWSN